MPKIRILLISLLLFPSIANAEFPTSWKHAKNTAQDKVYKDTRTRTFYCGCPYTTHYDDDGSGDVNLATCNMQALPNNLPSATRIEWEHIVPASQMPARLHPCWDESDQFSVCVSPSGNVTTKRDCCVRVKHEFRAMIFDLHNIAPAIGQVNQYRSNGRYGVVGAGGEQWVGCDAKDLGQTSPGAGNLFEPPDCMKGNVARVWLYMADVHGVVMTAAERATFSSWDQADPVSPWEKERDRRIEMEQGNSNPYVASRAANDAGKCSWE